MAYRLLDVALLPVSGIGAVALKAVRTMGIDRLPLHRRVLDSIGVFPIRDHYYEPAFARRDLPRRGGPRELPGINLDLDGQLALLDSFDCAEELRAFPTEGEGHAHFYYENGFFEAADAEFLYAIIRHGKPSRIVEIGSGFSTIMARAAIERNMVDDPGYRCRHQCIEPYENSWLGDLDVELIRTPVQAVSRSVFEELGPGDILFIDSSHVIRPGGDVLSEYLEILPVLGIGVLVQVHDIFTPRDYPHQWMVDEVRLWNEQYLLEAFLSFNAKFSVIGALNHLADVRPDKLAEKFPAYAARPHHQPGSFWLRVDG